MLLDPCQTWTMSVELERLFSGVNRWCLVPVSKNNDLLQLMQ